MRKPQLPPGVIPFGATHFFHNPEQELPSSNPWRKALEGRWYMLKNGQWSQISASKSGQFVLIADLLKQEKEWTGEGEPPIGSLVEFDTGGGNWVTVTVFAIKEGTLHQVDVLFDGPEGWGVIGMGSPRLRPVKSAEELAIDTLVGAVVNATGGIIYDGSIRTVLEALQQLGRLKEKTV